MDSVIDVCLFDFSYEPRLLIMFYFVSAASDGAENRRLGVRENSEFDATGETTGREAGCQGALADLGVYSTLQTAVRRINQRLLYVLDERLQHIAMLYVVAPISAPYSLPVALETKIADAQVKYKRVDLQLRSTQRCVFIALLRSQKMSY